MSVCPHDREPPQIRPGAQVRLKGRPDVSGTVASLFPSRPDDAGTRGVVTIRLPDGSTYAELLCNVERVP